MAFTLPLKAEDLNNAILRALGIPSTRVLRVEINNAPNSVASVVVERDLLPSEITAIGRILEDLQAAGQTKQ